MAVYKYSVNLKDGVSASAKQAASNVRGLADQMKSMPGSASGLSSAMNGLGDSMKGAGSSSMGLQEELAELTGGLSLVIEAVGAVALGFGALVFAGAALAISANEAKAKMTSLFDALGEGKITGAATIKMLDDLGDSIGQTRKQLAPFAQTFMAMGVTGTEQLRQLTLAAASAGALAEGGGDAFTTMFKKINVAAETGQKLKIPLKGLGSLASMGLNVADVAKKMGVSQEKLAAQLKSGSVDAKKFGDAMQGALIDKGAGPLQKAGAALSNVWGKFQENISKLFEDVDVGPFLDAVKDLFDVFGQGKASGQALKSGIGGFFKEVFAQATKVVPLVKHFFLDMIIFGLKAYIAAKPIVKWFKEVTQNAAVIKTVTSILNGLKIVFIAIGIALLPVIVLIVAAVAAIVLVNLAAVALIAAFYFLIDAVTDFTMKTGKAITEWASGAVGAAKDFISGLVNGITSGVGAVVDAVTGLAGKAKGAFKSALGIASPSKVMMQMGSFAGQGVAEGMTAAAPDVHAASGELADAAAGGMASGGGKGGGGGGSSGGSGGVTLNIEKGAIVIDGAGKSAGEITEAMFASVFERMALARGVG